MRVGILASHPIQYHSPWFRALAREVDLRVFYAHNQTAQQQAEAGFGVSFEWDTDLLSGYQHSFLRNISAAPNTERFGGCDTPEIACKVSGFDVFLILGWYLKSYVQAAEACKRYEVPALVRGDSMLKGRSRYINFLKRFTHRRLLKRFNGFLYVGRRNAEYLRFFGADEAAMFFVPHFVDNAYFADRAAEARRTRDIIRNTWGACDETLVALFVGKLTCIKRPLDLLRAAALHKNGQSKILCLLVGAGPLEGELRAEADRLGVQAFFAGFKNQSELPIHYAGADVLVLPSERETWGLVVNEAMACGIPAIVSDGVGCQPDLVDEGQTGFSYPVGNIATLRDAFGSFDQRRRNGHDFRPALGRKMKSFSLEVAVERTLHALRQTSSRGTSFRFLAGDFVRTDNLAG